MAASKPVRGQLAGSTREGWGRARTLPRRLRPDAPAESGRSLSSGIRKIGADQLLVIAGEDVAVGKSGMRPAYRSRIRLAGGGLDELRTADLLILLRREPADDQLSLLREYPGQVAVLNQVAGSPHAARDDGVHRP